MKRILFLVLAVSCGAQAHAKDAASSFVAETLTQAQNILAEKDDTARNNGMCVLLKARMNSERIAAIWLDTYATLQREQQAVGQFPSLVPSIMMTKAIPLLGGGGEGSLVVDEISNARGNNIYEVGVTVTANGKNYKGSAIVEDLGSGVFKINDAEYKALSAVNYQGRDFQQFMKREYQKDPANSMPVTALIQHITSDSDYINCP